jgi:hypothetical protein
MTFEQEILTDIKHRCGTESKPYPQALKETAMRFELTTREVETLVLEEMSLPIIETTDEEIAAKLAA